MGDLYVSPETNSAMVNDHSIKFDTQDVEENVILLLRRHWVTNFPWMMTAVFFLFAPIILSAFPILNFLPLNYQFMAVIIWYLLVIAFIYEQFLSWYFNIYLITDQRVIDYDFYNLLYKKTTDADLEKIQDVSVKMGGVAQVLFNYGDVFIETAGSIPNIDFEKVPNPSRIQTVIHELRDQVNSKPK